MTPCVLSNDPRLHFRTHCVTERVTSSLCFISPVFVTCFAVWRILACSVRPHRVAWLQWMKPEWQIAWLQSPQILAFTEAIARKYVHLRAQAGGERESRVLCSLFCKFKTLFLFSRGCCPRVTWPSRFRIVQKTETLPSKRQLPFSRNLQHQRRSAKAHGESPRRVNTQSERIGTALSPADYAK